MNFDEKFDRMVTLSKEGKFGEVEGYLSKMIFDKGEIRQFFDIVVFPSIEEGNSDFLDWWMKAYFLVDIDTYYKGVHPLSRWDKFPIPIGMLGRVFREENKKGEKLVEKWIENGGKVEVLKPEGQQWECLKSFLYLKRIAGKKDWNQKDLTPWIYPLKKHFNGMSFRLFVNSFIPREKFDYDVRQLRKKYLFSIAKFFSIGYKGKEVSQNIVLPWLRKEFLDKGFKFSLEDLIELLQGNMIRVPKEVYDFWIDYFSGKETYFVCENCQLEERFCFQIAIGKTEKVVDFLNNLQEVLEEDIKVLEGIANFASKFSNLNLLDLWKQTCQRLQIVPKASQQSLKYASKEGSIDSLDWWKCSDLTFESSNIGQRALIIPKVSLWWRWWSYSHIIEVLEAHQ